MGYSTENLLSFLPCVQTPGIPGLRGTDLLNFYEEILNKHRHI